MSKVEEDDVVYLPVQLVSETNSNDYVYHNVLLKKLPDGTFVFDTNQIIVQDDINNENNEEFVSNYQTAEDVSVNSGLVKDLSKISENTNSLTRSQKNDVSKFNNEEHVSGKTNHSYEEKSAFLETTDKSKSHNLIEGKPGVRYYQNKKQIIPKGPGRPRKDGIIRPRVERLGPFQCSFCEKIFDLYLDLRKHEKQHVQEKAYQCSKCNSSFNLMCNYRLHLATHEKELHACPECHKTFNRQASLRAHLMLHCVDDNLICINCGTSVETQALLDQHKKICADEKYHSGSEKIVPNISVQRFFNKPSSQKTKFGNKLGCTICKKSFKKPSQLVRHIRIHTGEKPFKCNICNRGFSQKGSLIIHKVKHSGDRPYSCTLCPATFAQKGNLQAHQKRVHPINLDHSKIDSLKKVFACQKCSCVFKRLGSLNSHMNKLHSGNSASLHENSALNDIKTVMDQLSELQNMSPDKDILQQAVKISGLDKKFNASQSNLLHEEGIKNYPESAVNRITVFDNLYGDKLRCYVVKQRKVGGIKWRQCNYCTREFRKPSDLIRHLRIHTKEKPFKCPQCLRRFTVKSTLTAHLKTHTGLKSFVCSICQKLFSSPSSLKVHIRLHTGDKPFKCQICEKSFRTSGMLQTHKATKCRKHIVTNEPDLQNLSESKETSEELSITCNERPYFICTTCGRSFNDENILKVHLMSHSVLKPFKCLVKNCSMLFKTMTSLRIHTEKHSELKSYICPYCQKTFKTKLNCRKHIKEHKNNDTNDKQIKLAENLDTAQQICSENLQSGFTLPTHLIISNNDIIINENENNFGSFKTIDENNEQTFSSVNQNINMLPITNCIVIPKNLNIINKDNNSLEDKIILDNSSGNLYQVSEIMQSDMKLDGNTMIQSDVNKNNGSISLINDQVSFNSNTMEKSSLTLFTTNNRTAMIMPSRNTNCDNASAYINLKSNGTHNSISSFLTDNIQYSIQNYGDILNGTIIEQTASGNKDNDSEHTKQQNEGVANNIFLKKFMINFQNQLDILSLESAESSLERISQDSCIQEFGSDHNEINIQSQVEDSHDIPVAYDDEDEENIQSIDFNYDSRDSSQQIIECDSNNQKDNFTDGNQSTEDNLLQQDNNSIIKTNNLGLNVSYSSGSHVDNTHIPDTLEIASQHINNQNEEIDSDSDKYLRCKTKSLSESEQAFLDYIYQQHKESSSSKVAQHPNKCSYCIKSFKKPSDLTRHIRVHTGEKPYSCEVCHKRFSLKTSLDCHMVTHNKPNKTIICSVCNSSFSTKGSLKVHMRLHTGSRPFECPLCKMTFRTSGHKRAHLLVHYRGAFREGKDPKDIITKGNKILHIMGSLTNELYNYSQMNEITQPIDNQNVDEYNFDESINYYYEQDMQLPDDLREKSDRIDIDQQENMTSEFFDKQMFSETIRSFQKQQAHRKHFKQQCLTCDKTFKKPSQLIRHQLIHTGEKPYQCDICSKAFNQKNGLETHMRHHTGIRPHECPYCSRSFSQKGNLKTHIFRTHGSI